MPQGRLVRAVRYVWASPNTVIGACLLLLAMGPGSRIRRVDGVIEAHGPLIAAFLYRWIPLPNGASAITFGHVVLGCDSRTLDATREHERAHVRQYERWGPAFIPAYLLASAWSFVTGRDSYEDNWFEQQARATTGSLGLLPPLR